MLQGNKNKLSHRVRVRDNNERKNCPLLCFLCGVLSFVNSPSLAFLAVSSGEREMAWSPLVPG